MDPSVTSHKAGEYKIFTTLRDFHTTMDSHTTACVANPFRIFYNSYLGWKYWGIPAAPLPSDYAPHLVTVKCQTN